MREDGEPPWWLSEFVLDAAIVVIVLLMIVIIVLWLYHHPDAIFGPDKPIQPAPTAPPTTGAP